jgi:PST family polysaccharide transporter
LAPFFLPVSQTEAFDPLGSHDGASGGSPLRCPRGQLACSAELSSWRESASSMNTTDREDASSAEPGASPADPFAVSLSTSDLKSRSVRGTLATGLSQGVKVAIQIGSQVVLARLLFPAEFGLLAMAYPILSLAQVFNDIGLGQAIIQRPTLATSQVSTLFWVNVGISCALALLVALLAPLAGWIYGEPRVVLLTVVLALTLPIGAMSLAPNALLVRHMQFGIVARNEVACMMVATVITITAAYEGLSYWSLVLGQFGNVIMVNALAWTSNTWRPTKPKFDIAAWNDVKFGANITLSNLATFVTSSGDNVIVALAAGKVQLGLYDRSYNLVVRPIGQVMSPMTRVASSLLSRLLDQASEYRSAYLSMVRISIYLIVPAMLVFITNAATLIAVFLGPRWSAASPIFAWICVGGLTSGAYYSFSWLFISQNRSSELKYFAAVAAVINVASYLIGAIWGVMGIVSAAAIGFVFITTPLMLIGSTWHGPVRLSDMLKCVVPFIVVGLSVYFALYLEAAQVTLTGLSKLLVATAISYSLFVGLSLVDPANRQLLRSTYRSARNLLHRN